MVWRALGTSKQGEEANRSNILSESASTPRWGSVKHPRVRAAGGAAPVAGLLTSLGSLFLSAGRGGTVPMILMFSDEENWTSLFLAEEGDDQRKGRLPRARAPQNGECWLMGGATIKLHEHLSKVDFYSLFSLPRNMRRTSVERKYPTRRECD